MYAHCLSCIILIHLRRGLLIREINRFLLLFFFFFIPHPSESQAAK